MLCHVGYVVILFLTFLEFLRSLPIKSSFCEEYRDKLDINDINARIALVNKWNKLCKGDTSNLVLEGFDIRTHLKHRRKRRNSLNIKDWPKHSDGLIYIPYTINDRFLRQRISTNLLKAREEYKKHTCFRLIPRSNEVDYIDIVDRSGCWSYVGKIGGRQELSLSEDCEPMNVIIHEFMHVIGFYHEQSRRDRDEHIYVNFTNIAKDNYSQFKVRDYGTTFVHGKEYDIHSIMQYGRTVGAVDDRYDAMTPIKNPGARLGVVDGSSFSPSDIEELNYKTMCGTDIKVYAGAYKHKGETLL